MRYILSQDITFGEIGGHMVFLDLAKDRYFRLESSIENSLRPYLKNGGPLPFDLSDLIASGILIEDHDTAPASLPSISKPCRSAFENHPSTDDGLAPSHIIETMLVVLRMHWKLRHQKIRPIIENEVAYRRKNSKPRRLQPPLDASTVQASRQFLKARRYVPIEPRCLLDSLSLLHFLSRRGLPASIIFGVTLEPFSAHCWVQSGDALLNETLGTANAHTPIRVV
ncbi:lasso peptide biosynthesis B2 protein [Pseudoxanthomonas sp.]|uniref:lasso peptide biosynthesis B2 protein n=1 Tax=Pseudoxanthomonas sp. TaxID=1871049 RepID=UPI00260BEA15|nr:lasso peptide biosynthesis B2 protein [Pseudoxanthomonas sp.]WDS34746.1 MAG: lasso peptide biosynthesis B2 protein [Pseudoxanthomonas sp.]